MITKNDIASKVAADLGITKVQGAAALDSVVAAITAGLTDGQDVKLTGIGTFKRVAKPATTARNPRTGEQMPVAAKNVVKFSPSSDLKTAIN